MQLLASIPALPATDIARSVAFYRDHLGMPTVHQEDGFAIVERDGVRLHLWTANDERWRERPAGGGVSPVISGAESFLAGTPSCRFEVRGIDALYATVRDRRILHPRAHLTDQPWGDRDFGVLDPDGNLVTFFERA